MVDTTVPRQRAGRIQKTFDVLTRSILRSRWLHGLMSRRLMLLEVVGRRTGKRYLLPVAYAEHDGVVITATPMAWPRNLSAGTPVTAVVRGRTLRAEPEVIADEARVGELFGVLLRANPMPGRFMKVRLRPDGIADPVQVRDAVRRGVVIVRLHPPPHPR